MSSAEEPGQKPAVSTSSPEPLNTRILIGLAVLLSLAMLWLRGVNLDRMYFWRDEAATLLACLHRPETDFSEISGRIQHPIDFQSYVTKRESCSIQQVVENFRMRIPDHMPLYYSLALVSAWQFGITIGVIRTVAMLISLLQVPLIAWLCFEAFGGVLIPCLASIFVAVSPHFFLYAREAREYSLWSCTTMLSTVLLLRAMRLQTRIAWCMFAIAQVLLFQTHLGAFLFFALLAIPLAKNKHNLTRYVLASLPGVLLCAIWLNVLGSQLQQGALSTWLKERRLEFLILLQTGVSHYQRLLADFATPNTPYEAAVMAAVTCLILVTLFVFIRKSTPWRTLFCVVLIGYPAVLIATDLILGGVRSEPVRYQTPAVVFLYVALAYVLGRGISSRRKPVQTLSIVSAAFVVIIGVVSCLSFTTAKTCEMKSLVHELKAAPALIASPGSDTLCVCETPAILLVMCQLVPSSCQLERGHRDEMGMLHDGIKKVLVIDEHRSSNGRALAEFGWIRPSGTPFYLRQDPLPLPGE